MHKHFCLPSPPKNILVIALRHLGDVVLCTPLISSLQQAYPQANINVLVYKSTASILEGNPDINEIITVSNKPDRKEYLALVKQIFRHYDLAVVTQCGDRPYIYSLLASGKRIGLVPDKQSKGWWKRYLVKGWAEFDDVNTHTVIQLLQLMDVLKKPRLYQLTTTAPKALNTVQTSSNYAVLHLYPLWTYKRWTLEGWTHIAHYLLEHNIKIILTGGPDKSEIDYVTEFHKQLPTQVINLAGKTNLGQLSNLISHAKLFIGPDTGVTHLAAATGTPTISLFGPTNPIKWAPWPKDYSSETNPFIKKGNQHINNVYLIQGKGDCVPCHLEGCNQHRESHSTCLDSLAPEEVVTAIDQILQTS